MKKINFLKRSIGTLVMLLVFVLVANNAFAQWNTWCYKDFTSDATYTLPSNCTGVVVEAIGGGGAGGAAVIHTGAYFGENGGGGGGAYARSTTYKNTNMSGKTLTIKVGAGGTSPVTGSQVNGGNSYVSYDGSVFVKAVGGLSVGRYETSTTSGTHGKTQPGAAGGSASDCIGDAGAVFSGGHGSVGADTRTGDYGVTGNRIRGGAGGGAAGGNGNGSDGYTNTASRNESQPTGGAGGGGAASDLNTSLKWLAGGAGANGTFGTNGWESDNSGNNYGGGGSGTRVEIANDNNSHWGGAGAPGIVRVWFHIQYDGPTVTVDPTAATNPASTNQTITATASNVYGTASYSWSNGTTGAAITVAPTVTTTYTVTLTDKYTPATSACSVTKSASSKITVLSMDIDDATATICSGNSFEVTPTGKVPTGTKYSWETFTVPGITGIVGATDQTKVSGTLTNTTTAPIDVVYNVTASDGLQTDDFTVTVTVNPATDAGSIAPETWKCTATDTTVIITGPAATPAGGTYKWLYSTTSTGTYTEISGANAASYVATQTGYYKRSYAATCGSGETTPAYVESPSDVDPGYVTKGGSETDNTYYACDNASVSISLASNATGFVADSIQWQTSEDNENWTNTSTKGYNYTYTANVTKNVYIRYIVKVGDCQVPAKNFFTVFWVAKPTVTVKLLSGTCPGVANYELEATVTVSELATIGSYTWSGDATGTTKTGIITPTSPQNCGETYSYQLTVADNYGCSSSVNSDFTIDNPSDSLKYITTLPDQTAVLDGVCTFKVPDVTTALNTALKAACGNSITAYEFNETDMSMAVGTSKTFNIKSLTDMCGTHNISPMITVKVDAPAAPTVTIAAADTFLCPGETTLLTPNVTGTGLSYKWTPGDATSTTLTTTAYTTHSNTAHKDTYSVVITDVNECTATASIDIFTTPKAYLTDKTFTGCSGDEKVIYPGSGVPRSTTADALGFTYRTYYTWTHTSVTGVYLTSDYSGTAQTSFTTGANPLVNETLENKTVVYTVTPHSETVKDSKIMNLCEGSDFTISVTVKPDIHNEYNGTTGIDNFDDEDVIITLWYGACDTLYVVTPPSFDNNFIGDFRTSVVLTNSKGGHINTGTFFGRMIPGEYTITWRVSSDCGYIDYPKKYIVRYPNCGDADPMFPASEHPYLATDADGNQYHTIRIGCECWIDSNLRTNTANSMVYYSDDHRNTADNAIKFGRLYTWYTATGVAEGNDMATPTVLTEPSSHYKYVQGVCPEGWALPTTDDILNMLTSAGNTLDKIKSSDITAWLPGATGTNESGFSARGAGYYDNVAERYVNLLGETYFWTCDVSNSTVQKGVCSVITHSCPEMLIQDKMKGLGYSVRCLKRFNY